MGHRIYAMITETGICDAKGRKSCTSGWRGKVIAKPDRPVSTLVQAIMERIHTWVGWSGGDAANEDFDEAIRVLNRFRDCVDWETEREQPKGE